MTPQIEINDLIGSLLPSIISTINIKTSSKYYAISIPFWVVLYWGISNCLFFFLLLIDFLNQIVFKWGCKFTNRIEMVPKISPYIEP